MISHPEWNRIAGFNFFLSFVKKIFSFSPRYKCHKECVPNAPPNCGFSERQLKRVLDKSEIQSALGKKWKHELMFDKDLLLFTANSSPLPRKDPYPRTYSIDLSIKIFIWDILEWDPISPTASTPTTAPGSPATHSQISGYPFNPPIHVSQTIYSSKYRLNNSYRIRIEQERYQSRCSAFCFCILIFSL